MRTAAEGASATLSAAEHPVPEVCLGHTQTI
jgi:hypothetical protein